jgi:hypothetical protein
MAEALPEGDTPPPTRRNNSSGFMSFHSEDCAKYVESRQRLCNKTLESVAEYFENIYNSQVANGSLAKKSEHQVEYCAIMSFATRSRSTTMENWVVTQNSITQAMAAVMGITKDVLLSRLQVEGLQPQLLLPQLQQMQEETGGHDKLPVTYD